VSSQHFFTDADAFTRAQLLVSEYYNLDVPHLFMDGRDAWASPPMITLDMMDTYVVRYTERLREKLGEVPFEVPQRESFAEFMRSKGSTSLLTP